LIAYLRLQGVPEFGRGTATIRSGMQGAAGAAEELGGAVGTTERALINAGRQSAVAASGTAKYRAAQLSAVAATERYNTVLADSTATVRQMATAEAALIRANERVRASAPTSAILETGRATQVAEERMTGFRSSAASSVETLAKLGVGLGAFELARKAIEFVSAGKELTDSLNQVQAASRASDAEMGSVRAQALALGKDLSVPAATAVDAADAILELVKAGIKLPRALEAARPALLLAAATNTNMADTAKVLGDTMDVWQISGDKAAHVANILASSALGASHDLMGLFDAIKTGGPTATALGIGFDDTAAAITLLAKNAISTTMAGNGLKVMLTSLTKDSPATKRALADLGVTAFNQQGKFIGFSKLFDQLHSAQKRFGPDSEAFLRDLNMAFGARAQSVAKLFAKEGGEAYDAVVKRLESGNLQRYADLMNRGVAAGFRQLNKEATAAGIAVYSKFEPSIAAAVTWLGTNLPHAASGAQSALRPLESFIGEGLGAAFHLLGEGIHYAGDVLGPVSHLIGDLETPLGAAAAAALAMWAALKVSRGVVVAYDTVRFAVASVAGATRNGIADFTAYGRSVNATLAGNATESQLASRIMQADFAEIAASALQSAAEVRSRASDRLR
jgi:TP901 family phage tail tape measure protein